MEPPLRSYEELFAPFVAAEKRAELIGVEGEKFGVEATTGKPLQYEGERGVVRIFDRLVASGRWEPEREEPGAPIIALDGAAGSITLEPGAQFELSAAPVSDVHGMRAAWLAHLDELAEATAGTDLVWLGVGFHPFAEQRELPWVPKQRYGVMKTYLPPRGSGALDMMRRTATVQANFDYASEEDALRKLSVLLRLSALIHAMTANSPFREAKLAGKKSVRGDVWLRMDPQRSGLIPRLWDNDKLGYRDYVEWALDAGMFLFKRDGQPIINAGQSFRSFLKDGYEGYRATLSDWKLHLNTLFPEVRLKNTLEFRPCDGLSTELACAAVALVTGLIYDAVALGHAETLCREWQYEEIERLRPELCARGLTGRLAGHPVRALAEQLMEIATAGLDRRARRDAMGVTERIYLKPLAALVEHGKSPADLLIEGLTPDGVIPRAELIERTRLR